MRRGVLLCALATGCSAKECLTDADCTDREATCDRRRACDGGDSPSWSDADGNRTCAWVREDPSGRCGADGSEPRLEVECNDQGGCAYLVELEASPASAACCESCRLGSCEEPKRRRKTSRRLRTLFAAVFLLYAAGVVAALLLVAACVCWCRVVSRASAAAKAKKIRRRAAEKRARRREARRRRRGEEALFAAIFGMDAIESEESPPPT